MGGSSFGWGVYIGQKTASHHGGDGGWRSESTLDLGDKENVALRNQPADFLAFTYVIASDDLMFISKSLRKPLADRFPAFS